MDDPSFECWHFKAALLFSFLFFSFLFFSFLFFSSLLFSYILFSSLLFSFLFSSLLFSSLLRIVQTRSGAHLAFYSLLYFERYWDRCIKLTTHLPLALRLRMSGAIPPQPQVPLRLLQGQIYLYEISDFRLDAITIRFLCYVARIKLATIHDVWIGCFLSVSSSGFKQNQTMEPTRQWRTKEFCSVRGGGFQQIQLTTEDRQNGDLWAVAP